MIKDHVGSKITSYFNNTVEACNCIIVLPTFM